MHSFCSLHDAKLCYATEVYVIQFCSVSNGLGAIHRHKSVTVTFLYIFSDTYNVCNIAYKHGTITMISLYIKYYKGGSCTNAYSGPN